MNSHSDIRKLLSAYCGDDLPAHERSMVEAHLKSCPACRVELADLNTTLQLIRTNPEVEPPPWMTARIMANVRDAQTRKQSWLKYIFFPLHIKIPLELTALLVVCVSGYYMSRSVETELKVSRTQEAPGSLLLEEKAVKRETLNQPTTSPSGTTPKAPTQNSLDRPVDTFQRSAPSPAAPVVSQPAFEAERLGAPTEQATKTPPAAADFSNRSLEAAKEMKKKAEKGVQRHEIESVSPAPANDSGGKYIPQLLLRLTVADSSTAAESIRAAVIRSGAKIIEEIDLPDRRIRIRIHAARITELAELLNRIGRLTERPQPQNSGQELEVTILW